MSLEPNGENGTDSVDVVLLNSEDANESEAPEANEPPLPTTVCYLHPQFGNCEISLHLADLSRR